MVPLHRKNINSDKPATKGDLELLREDMHGDMDAMERRLLSAMSAIEKRYDQKLDDWRTQLFEKIDIAVENRQADLGAAKREHVMLLDDNVQALDRRVAAIELRYPVGD